MECPERKNKAPVQNTRRKTGYRVRRYFCECGNRFSTREVIINREVGLQDRLSIIEDLTKLDPEKLKAVKDIIKVMGINTSN